MNNILLSSALDLDITYVNDMLKNILVFIRNKSAHLSSIRLHTTNALSISSIEEVSFECLEGLYLYDLLYMEYDHVNYICLIIYNPCCEDANYDLYLISHKKYNLITPMADLCSSTNILNPNDQFRINRKILIAEKSKSVLNEYLGTTALSYTIILEDNHYINIKWDNGSLPFDIEAVKVLKIILVTPIARMIGFCK